MEIEFDNIFYASVIFGLNQSEEIIIAKDLKDAIKTINNYYSEPLISYIVSAKELIYFLDKIESDQKENHYFVLEIVIDGNEIKRQAFEEIGISMEELKIKYEKRECVFLHTDVLKQELEKVLSRVAETSETALISELFSI
jgi:hypothetical protein